MLSAFNAVAQQQVSIEEARMAAAQTLNLAGDIKSKRISVLQSDPNIGGKALCTVTRLVPNAAISALTVSGSLKIFVISFRF
jgi:hypothetical protein